MEGEMFAVMVNEAKTLRPRLRPKPRGRGHDYEAEAKNKFEKVPDND